MPVTVVLLLLSIAGCGSDEKSDVAVREAVRAHLATLTDLSLGKMTVEVESVEYEGRNATAQVTIAARDDPQASMKMSYRLRRSGSQWIVEAPAAGSSPGAHGGAGAGGGAMPPGHPPANPPIGQQPKAGGQELPPGHPPVQGGPASQELPQGHPPVAQ